MSSRSSGRSSGGASACPGPCQNHERQNGPPRLPPARTISEQRSTLEICDRCDPVTDDAPKPTSSDARLVIKRVAFGAIGLLLGAFFLYLALRNVTRRELSDVPRRLDRGVLAAGVAIYIASIAPRCVRWGLLLRATGSVKWRHVAEALIAGFAANYLLPARIGELFRADYAMRLFHMSRFTSLGTIFVERVFDGVILVCGLW